MGQVIETEADGRLIIPAEVLGAIRPNQQFFIEANGLGYSLQPAMPFLDNLSSPSGKPTPEQWLKQWKELAEEIGKVWPEGVSATQVISEMRR